MDSHRLASYQHLHPPHCGSGAALGAADVCHDSDQDHLYVIDQGDGIFCQYNLAAFGQEIEFLAAIAHPFGPAAFPLFTPLCRGLAYDSGAVSFRLQVLVRISFKIKLMQGRGTAGDRSWRGLFCLAMPGHG